jgi:4-oxalocrotonate tautomerase
MPIVHVEMFPGRTTVMKEFLGRAISDAISEIAGPPRENVQVVFRDVPTDEWSIGPTLVASRPAGPSPDYVPAVVALSRLALRAGVREDWLAWRRDALFPFLASQQGFLSSTLLAGDDVNAYFVVEKWVSPEARERSAALPTAAELREAESAFLATAPAEERAGRVIDVFRGRG